VSLQVAVGLKPTNVEGKELKGSQVQESEVQEMRKPPEAVDLRELKGKSGSRVRGSRDAETTRSCRLTGIKTFSYLNSAYV